MKALFSERGSPPRILLLQHHALVGERLRASLASQPGWLVGGPADSLHTAMRLWAAAPPDLLLADLSLRDGPLGALLAAWRERGLLARTQVLVTVLSAEDTRLMQALRLGADGYFLHGGSAAQLVSAVKQVLAGESGLSPQIARQLRRHFVAAGWKVQSGGPNANSPFSLAPAERLILARASEGYSTAEIAGELGTTVERLGLKVRGLYRKFRFDTQGLRALKQAA